MKYRTVTPEKSPMNSPRTRDRISSHRDIEDSPEVQNRSRSVSSKINMTHRLFHHFLAAIHLSSDRFQAPMVLSTFVLVRSASIASPVIIPVSQASRTDEWTKSLDSFQSLMNILKKISRESIRSTASTISTPNTPPVVVNQVSGASRAVECAESQVRIHSSFFSHHTIDSIVIAHKVGRCAGIASLYAWNSFISEDFSSVAVNPRVALLMALRLSFVIEPDLITDYMMDLFSLFSGLVEFIALPKAIMVDDKLSKSHESCYTSCSWCSLVELVCTWFSHSISRHLGSGTVSSEGEQSLENYEQLLDVDIDMKWLEFCNDDHVYTEDCIMVLFSIADFKLLSRLCNGDSLILVYHLNFRRLSLFLKPSVDCFAISVAVSFLLLVDAQTGIDIMLSWLQKKAFLPSSLMVCYGNHYLSSYVQRQGEFSLEFASLSSHHHVVVHRFSTEVISGFMDEATSALDCLSIHLQSQDYECNGDIFEAHSGWLRSILDLLYCSLPRPPEVLYDVSFSLLKFK